MPHAQQEPGAQPHRMLLGWSSRSTDDTVLFQNTTLPEALSRPPASSS